MAVTVSRTQLRLTVSDDGQGFRQLTRGKGIAIMQDRMAAVGGSCSINGTPGSGTTVSVAIPRVRD